MFFRLIKFQVVEISKSFQIDIYLYIFKTNF